MAKLKSELELTCPCCNATLVVDVNLGRIVAHKEPERGNKPELSEAQRILAEEAARREAIFQQSVDAEKTKPMRDFDLDLHGRAEPACATSTRSRATSASRCRRRRSSRAA
jgi:hypothetical protein